MDAERRVKKAKISLMRNPKFALLSGILMVGGTSVTDEEGITAYTNGKDEMYGRKFTEMLTDRELAFVVAHENYHKMYRHLTTWEKLHKENPALANAAADYVVNYGLRELDPDETVIAMPRAKDGPNKGQFIGLYDKKYGGMHVKQVYDLLKQEQEDDPQDGDGQPSDGSGEGSGRTKAPKGFDEHDWQGAKEMSAEEKAELERDIDQALRQGLLAQKLRGTGGSQMDREIAEMLEPKVDWREVLRDYVKSFCAGKDKSTWRRPNRRLLGEDIYLPSLMSEKVGHLVVGIDTSGSVGGAELQAFLSEVQGIAEEVKPEKVDLLYWDHTIAAHESYSEGAVSLITRSTKPRGGGGTVPSCVPEYLKLSNIKPECVIMLTDGVVGNDWGSDWPAPVLWVVTTKGVEAGCGKTVRLEM